MDLGTWDDLLEHDELDAQHASLAAGLLALVAEADLEARRIGFAHLVKEYQAHFEWEEQAMSAAAYPGLHLHRRDHRREIASLLSIQRDLDSEAGAAQGLLHSLVWLRRHTRSFDSELAAYLADREVWDLRRELDEWEFDSLVEPGDNGALEEAARP